MKSILDLLRRPTPSTAADLRAALAGLPPRPEAEAAVAALKAQRDAKLLDGTSDAAIDRLDREIVAAQREVDRIAAAQVALAARVAEAERVERLDDLAAERDAAEDEAATVAALFAKRYDATIDELVGMVGRLDAIETRIVAVNGRLAAGGFDDKVASAETRLRLGVPVMWARRFAFSVAFERGQAR